MNREDIGHNSQEAERHEKREKAQQRTALVTDKAQQ
jgi:hypothetical protein